jgi:hypothetical protein
LIAIGTYTINTCTSLIFYIFLPRLPLLILPSPLT